LDKVVVAQGAVCFLVNNRLGVVVDLAALVEANSKFAEVVMALAVHGHTLLPAEVGVQPVQFVSFGPVTLAHFHQQIQVTCNELCYSY
jgi:hypothetical protein